MKNGGISEYRVDLKITLYPDRLMSVLARDFRVCGRTLLENRVTNGQCAGPSFPLLALLSQALCGGMICYTFLLLLWILMEPLLTMGL